MSLTRQRLLTPADERFLIVRTLVARCAPGLRTTSPTEGWHRLATASRGVIIVRTPDGQWSAPTRNAVWVSDGARAEIETCAQTSLEILYIRSGKASWNRGGVLRGCRAIAVGPFLRAILDQIVRSGPLDRRVEAHVAMAMLVLHEVREGASEPQELVWPRDRRVARVASLVQAKPGDDRRLKDLCKGQGVSVRTVQRLFPLETGLTFENWRARVRFLHASRLLAEGHKVGAVAASCGYRSPSAFVASFARFAGITPGKFCRT